MKININDNIKVKLTEHGLKLLKEHYGQLNKMFNVKKEVKLDENGYFTQQLWSVMQIFGTYMYNGAPTIFENNSIEIDDSTVQHSRAIVVGLADGSVFTYKGIEYTLVKVIGNGYNLLINGKNALPQSFHPIGLPTMGYIIATIDKHLYE